MYKNPPIQRLRNRLYNNHAVKADVLRLDLIHPVISGNKYYKLKYYLESALASGDKGLLSFGGAYSNHLVALAYAAREAGLSSVGIVRGEETTNPSIEQMINAGMKVHFVSRTDYRNKYRFADRYRAMYPDHYIIPEGGKGPQGIQGASEIISGLHSFYTHVVCAVGTGATMAGIICSLSPSQQAVGILALKISSQDAAQLQQQMAEIAQSPINAVISDYHFGGYAKKTPELIGFMNRFYEEEGIPTDFVYTGKMFYAVEQLCRQGYFPQHSRILLIHSGGLQGNRSLPEGILNF